MAAAPRALEANWQVGRPADGGGFYLPYRTSDFACEWTVAYCAYLVYKECLNFQDGGSSWTSVR